MNGAIHTWMGGELKQRVPNDSQVLDAVLCDETEWQRSLYGRAYRADG